MTKLETTFDWPAPIPGFDLMKWKDETQAEILRETEGMTVAEVLDYFRNGSEAFREEQRLRRAEREQQEAAKNL
jgi:hypothetical protein